MEVEVVRIDLQSVSCNVCFNRTDNVESITDLREIFLVMLQESPIEVTDAYLEAMKACRNCIIILKKISDFRDALVSNISANTMEYQVLNYKQEEEPDALLCSACNTFKEEVYSASYLEDILKMLLINSGEIPQTKLEGLEFCDECRGKMEFFSEFQMSIVEEQLSALSKTLDETENKEDLSILSPTEIKKEDSESHEESLHEESSLGESSLEESSQDEDQTKKRIIKPKETPEGIYCDKCDVILKHKRSYQYHQRRKHGPKSKHVYCKECDKVFTSREALKSHLKYTVKHANKPFECKTCGERFLLANHLEKHIQFKHKGKKDPCPICGKVFRRTHGLRTHMYVVHSYRVRPKNIFSDKTKTKTKTKTKSKPEPNVCKAKPKESFQCDVCGNIYNTKHAIQTHLRYIHAPNEENVFCVTCNIQFKNSYRLRIHQRRSHYHMEKRFQCSLCDERFFTQPLLEGHIQYKHEQKGQQCPICKKVYQPPKGLYRHMRRFHYLPKVHPQVCKVCNKVIRTEYTMDIHMKTHDANRYRCEPCNLQFNKSDALQCHKKSKEHLDKVGDATDSTIKDTVRIIKAESPEGISCDKCDAILKNEKSYQRHQRSHGPESQYYFCADCDIVFTSAAGLKNHLKRTVKHSVHECKTCGKRFIDSTHLVKHIKDSVGSSTSSAPIEI